MNLPDILFWIIDKITIAVLTSLVASAVFFYVLSTFKPKIEISPEISKEVKKEGNIYRIKVINKTSAPIVNIRAQLLIFRARIIPGGHINSTTEIKLKQANPMVIQKYDLKDKDADYAYRFITYENIEDLCSDYELDFIRFRISCTHSISGFGHYYYKDYRLKYHDIVEGDFTFGNSLTIVPIRKR